MLNVMEDFQTFYILSSSNVGNLLVSLRYFRRPSFEGIFKAEYFNRYGESKQAKQQSDKKRKKIVTLENRKNAFAYTLQR